MFSGWVIHGILMFDEPVNGLEPGGHRLGAHPHAGTWPEKGRTVLVSSHLMSEMALTADHLIVIGRGRLIRDEEGQRYFVASSSRQSVRVRSPQASELATRLGAAGAVLRVAPDGLIEVTGLDAAAIGELAAAQGLVLHELSPQRASLEEAFMELTSDSVDFHARGAVAS